MTLASNLPAMRPTTDNYGPDLVDDSPVTDPTTELGSVQWNQLKADAAQMAATVPLAVLVVANNGSVATLTKAFGVAAGNVTVTRTGAGSVSCVFAGGTGLLVYAAMAMSNTTGQAARACTFTAGSGTVVVESAADINFTLAVY